jgi:hypothetical protein
MARRRKSQKTRTGGTSRRQSVDTGTALGNEAANDAVRGVTCLADAAVALAAADRMKSVGAEALAAGVADLTRAAGARRREEEGRQVCGVEPRLAL